MLRGTAAIVTGASRGIGKAVALTLAEHGASLVINGTNAELLNDLALQIEELGQKCVIHIGDAVRPETAAQAAEAAMEHFGRIDILVNNAGINMRSSTLEMKIEDWQTVLDVNLNGTLFLQSCFALYDGTKIREDCQCEFDNSKIRPSECRSIIRRFKSRH